jgi:hypothetical protein
MRIRTILAAAAAPAALTAILLGTAGQASAATNAPPVSAYFYNPSGNALGGPQAMPGGHVFFSSSYLAKITEKVNNANINGQTITITGHLDQGTSVADQPNGGDSSTPPGAPNMRVYFEGSGGGVSDGSPDGYLGQHWWAHPDSAVVYLNSEGTTEFKLTVHVGATGDWTDWNGKSADQNADLFTGAATHVRNIGVSFGGGYFFENGVTGTGGLTIGGITVSPTNPAS